MLDRKLRKSQNREITLSLSPKWRFMGFLIGGSCGLLLEAEQLDDLWFATTQPLKNYSKFKKIRFSGNKSLNNSRSV